MTTDPFANDDLDQVQEARSGFLGAGDFIGRLIMVKPFELIPDLPGSNGPYDALTCDIHVIDGGAGNEFEAPCLLEGIRLSGDGLVNALKPALKSGTWTLGRMREYPNTKIKNGNPSRRLDPPTAEDTETKNKYVAWVRTQRAQGGVTAAATTAPAAQPAPAAMAPKANPFG